MDIRQLRYFIGIADAGSISAAALQLHVAQPALSQQIARLEAEIGAKLLERNARGVTLTPAGEVLRERASLILRDLESAREATMAEAGGPIRGSITVGIPTTIAIALTLPILQGIREQFPSISLRLVESQSGHLLDWLLQSRIDIAFLFDVDGQKARDLVVTPMVVEELHLVSPPSSERDDSDVSLMDALELPVLLPSREHGFRRLLEGHAAKLGRAWNVVAEIDALLHLKRAVASGIAHTVLPKVAVAAELSEGSLHARRIGDPILRRTVMLATATSRAPTKAVNAVQNLILEIVRAKVESGEWNGGARSQASSSAD